MEVQLEVKRMLFHAYHGVYEEEKRVGNDFEVSVKYTMSFPNDFLPDRLEDTIDCQEVYNVVAQEMKTSSQLIEHVAWRIARELLSQFQKMKSVEVKVSKLHPPLLGETERTSAIISLQKDM